MQKALATPDYDIFQVALFELFPPIWAARGLAMHLVNSPSVPDGVVQRLEGTNRRLTESHSRLSNAVHAAFENLSSYDAAWHRARAVIRLARESGGEAAAEEAAKQLVDPRYLYPSSLIPALLLV